MIICPVNDNRNGAIIFYDTSYVGVKTAFVFIANMNTGILDMENDVNIKFG
jgi:hypothetical protein